MNIAGLVYGGGKVNKCFEFFHSWNHNHIDSHVLQVDLLVLCPSKRVLIVKETNISSDQKKKQNSQEKMAVDLNFEKEIGQKISEKGKSKSRNKSRKVQGTLSDKCSIHRNHTLYFQSIIDSFYCSLYLNQSYHISYLKAICRLQMHLISQCYFKIKTT